MRSERVIRRALDPVVMIATPLPGWRETTWSLIGARFLQSWHDSSLAPSAVRVSKTKATKGKAKHMVEKVIGSSSLVEVIDRILDKGIVVDAWVRVSLVGIEILAVEARVVVASVETYLKYAEAIGLTATAAA
jgi:hypothetical protein